MKRPDAVERPHVFAWEWTLFMTFLATGVLVLACWPDTALDLSLRSWAGITDWTHRHLWTITENSPLLIACLPTAFMFGLALLLQLVWDRPPNWVRLPVASIFLVFQVCYLVFRLTWTLSLDTMANAIVSVTFFLSELLVHARIAIGNFSMLHVTDRSHEADESERAIKAGEYLPSVDVFLPTYSEPVELLRRSIVGCQAMDYPNMTIWLLDDMRRPQMHMLAEELGCRYLDRPDNRGAKAGNVNHAIEQSTGELIVFFDADFIPTRDFIARTAGFFRDPQVAMVQTPQNFYNDDAVTRNLGLEHALEDEQKLFFRTLQPARDAANAIVCHGSCFIARRSAIDAIGGIPTETITEDWATSIKMQAAGYKLYYLNEALSAGMAADTCGEFVQQRARWAQGTLQGMFASTHPFRIRGLKWKQRALHMASILYYLGSVCNLLTLILPLFFLFGGVLVMNMTVYEMIFYRMPFTIGYYFLYSWLTLRTRSAFWSEFYDAFLAPTMGLTVLKSIFNPFGAGFRVTNKAHRTSRVSVNWPIATPFIFLLILHVAGIAFAIAANRHLEQRDAFWIVLFFTLSNMSILWVCTLVSMDVTHTSRYRRFEKQLAFELEWENGLIRGSTSAISEDEVSMPRLNPSCEFPNHAQLTIPGLAFERVQVRILADTHDGQIHLSLPDLPLAPYRRMIAELYCQPGQWDTKPKSELRAGYEYLRAGIRMYPLAEAA